MGPSPNGQPIKFQKMEEYLLTDHMSDYSELLIQYADKVVKDHVE